MKSVQAEVKNVARRYLLYEAVSLEFEDNPLTNSYKDNVENDTQ